MLGEEVLLTGSKTSFHIRLGHSHHFEKNVLLFHSLLCEVRNLVYTSDFLNKTWSYATSFYTAILIVFYNSPHIYLSMDMATICVFFFLFLNEFLPEAS